MKVYIVSVEKYGVVGVFLSECSALDFRNQYCKDNQVDIEQMVFEEWEVST